MDIKVLALDLDGTLLNEQRQISSRNIAAIRKAQQAGITIALASGRPLGGMLPKAEALGLDQSGGYLLGYNGGKIMDCRTGTMIKEFFLPQGILPRIFDIAKQFGAALLVHEGHTVVTETPDEPHLQLEAELNGLPVYRKDSLKEYVTFPVGKCLITGSGDYLGKIEPYVRSMLPELEIYRSDPFFLEIMPKGVDKGSGLSHLLDALGLTRENLACCGDGFNDISMIEFAEIGAAMGNAPDLIKDKADFVTLTNREDGVAYFIEQKLLG